MIPVIPTQHLKFLSSFSFSCFCNVSLTLKPLAHIRINIFTYYVIIVLICSMLLISQSSQPPGFMASALFLSCVLGSQTPASWASSSPLTWFLATPSNPYDPLPTVPSLCCCAHCCLFTMPCFLGHQEHWYPQMISPVSCFLACLPPAY